MCDLNNLFSHPDELCFRHKVTGLFKFIVIACNLNEWHLFINSSSRSLKAVLLHDGNMYPSLPLAHSVQLKEEYSSVKILLYALKDEKYSWEVNGDFKMVTFLMDFQGGFTKSPCYLCFWHSKDRAAHYHRRDWPQPQKFTILIPFFFIQN